MEKITDTNSEAATRIKLWHKPAAKYKNFAIVDAEMAEELNRWNWFFGGRYAARRERKDGKYHKIYMHSMVLPPTQGKEVDHINRNKLDNRKSNLRLVTRSQNMRNVAKSAATSSRYRGVYWFKPAKLWRAFINHNKKQLHIGYFHNEVEAAIAYNDKVLEMFGDLAQLNAID